MACAGCFPTQKELQAMMTKIEAEAKKFAIEKKQNVFIYVRQETGELAYMVEEAARAYGIIPVQVLSGLVPSA